MPEKTWRRRPWTYGAYRNHVKVTVPKIDTYVKEISECHQKSLKLRLSPDVCNDTSFTPLPYLFPRSKTSSRIEVSESKPWKLQSAPNESSKQRKYECSDIKNVTPEIVDKDDDANDVIDDKEQTLLEYDPIRLSTHLKDCGFGAPVMLTSSPEQEISRYKLPPGVKARKLPRNPSKREKIKGRARLDYEMANMRALAFCEQQTPKMFRTASAHMRNRDVQFVEDEMKENVHRDEIDDTGSIVMTIDRDELFQRIETWIEDVEKSCEKVP
ncbi:hypothetical protein FSP39_021591 [Pinctada imbricata]|uniref:Uncharacterized protein n=1 Tax=Pinctada imbricata TaxID=66713 RepID=A0AA88YBF9_PINIB|nr:hypothetical protein FSP39_021591 [Pinctada imbricata]